MKTAPLTYWDYLRAAFQRKAKVPGMGRLPVNYLYLAAVAVLGLANPGFWLLGAAGEVGYLTWLSSNPRFQKLLEGERLQSRQTTYDDRVVAALERMRSVNRARYEALLAQCRRILGISEALSGGSLGGSGSSMASLDNLKSKNLNQLLAIFLRLLTSREALNDSIQGVDREAVAKEIASLEGQLNGIHPETDTALARSLRGTLDIQRKRLDNLSRAQASLAVIDAELRRIEQQVELIREEAAVVGKTETLSDRLDAVTSAMAETEEWMRAHLDLIGVGEVASDAPALPALPTVRRVEEDA